MPDKLTDKEIANALECCLDVSDSTCKNCPLFNITNSTMVCSKIATKFALDLINRLQEENEELVGNIDKLKAELFDKTEQLNVELQAMRGAANSYKAENEKLKKEKDEYAFLYDKHINTAFSHIKTEAYREFAIRLLALIGSVELPNLELKQHINNLLNELVGDDE